MNPKKNVYSEMSWPDFQDYVGHTPYALLPVGALEQHGPHLPFSTDVIIAEYMAEKLAEKNRIHPSSSPFIYPIVLLEEVPGNDQGK